MELDHVSFFGRATAETLAGAEDIGMISITRPGLPLANIKPGFKHLLRLQFHNPSGGIAYDPFAPKFTRDHAVRIVEFCLRSDVRTMFVHCENGAVEAPAVALCIANAFDASLSREHLAVNGDAMVIEMLSHEFGLQTQLKKLLQQTA